MEDFKMKTRKMNKGTALLGAIAMVMIAIVSIVGVTFAWFSASPDPRVTGINAEVAGAETLLISQNGLEGTFRRTVTWAEINGTATTNGGPHASRLIPNQLTSVTPRALANGDLYIESDENNLEFMGGMIFSEALFTTWFNANEPTRDDVLGGTFGTAAAAFDRAKEINVNFNNTNWETSPALAWYTYDGSPVSTGWIYFPLFFRSLTGAVDIYLQLPTAVDSTASGTFVNSSGNATVARRLIGQSIRMAFIQNENDIDSMLRQTVYQPILSPSVNPQAENFLGDLLGDRGGGHIVPNLYNTQKWADGNTTITGGGGLPLIHIGTAPEFVMGSASTTVQIDVYIWVCGNDIYNTTFAANSDFLAQIQFFGIQRPIITTP
jgi:hypothetical protein